MKAEIKTFINPNIFSSNIYVVKGESTTIVIDCGFYDGDFKDYLKNLGKVDALLLTHGHGDHIRAVDELVKDYPNTKVYIHSQDKELLTNTELNCSFLVGRKAIEIQSKVNFLEGGDITIGEFTINVIHVPGHTNGCAMFYFRDLDILFLGDTVMEDSIGTLRTPTGDANKMEASLGKFRHLGLPENTQCYPGHGDVCSYGEILRINPFLHMR